MNKSRTIGKTRIRKGSYLAVALLTAVATTAIGATFISLTTTTSNVAEADFTEQNLVYLAESGIDHAMVTIHRYMELSKAGDNTWISPAPIEAKKEFIGDFGNNADTPFKAGGWTQVGDGYRKNMGEFTLGNGRKASMQLLIKNVPNPGQMAAIPIIYAEVSYISPGKLGRKGYSKQFAAKLKPKTRYQNSLIGRNSVTFGDNLSVSSYNSLLGLPTEINRGDKAVVGTMSAENGAIRGANPTIYGYLATGGDNPADNLGNRAHIYGQGSPAPYAGHSGTGIDPNRIAKDFFGTFPTPIAPSPLGWLNLGVVAKNLPVTNGLITLTTGSYKMHKALNLSDIVEGVTDPVLDLTGSIPILGGILNPILSPVVNGLVDELSITTLRILGDVVIIIAGDPNEDPEKLPFFKISGNSQLFLPIGSSLKIYTPGHVVIQGDGILNGVLNILSASGPPKDFMIFGTNTNTADGKRQKITIGGKGAFSGVIDAPNADITLVTGNNKVEPIVNIAGINLALSGGTNGVLVELGIGGINLLLNLFNTEKGLYGFQGAVIGYNVTSTGKFAFSYDEQLGIYMYPSFVLGTWVELKENQRINFSDYGF